MPALFFGVRYTGDAAANSQSLPDGEFSYLAGHRYSSSILYWFVDVFQETMGEIQKHAQYVLHINNLLIFNP